MSDRMTETSPRVSAGPPSPRCQGRVASAGPPLGVSGGRAAGGGRGGLRQTPLWHPLEAAEGPGAAVSEAPWPPGRPRAEVRPSRTDAHRGRCLPCPVTVWATSSASRTSPVVSIRSPATSRQVPSLRLSGVFSAGAGPWEAPPGPASPTWSRQGLSTPGLGPATVPRALFQPSEKQPTPPSLGMVFSFRVLEMLESSQPRGPSLPDGTFPQVPTGETPSDWATDHARPALRSGRGLPCQPGTVGSVPPPHVPSALRVTPGTICVGPGHPGNRFYNEMCLVVF